jgi:cytoskeletal protein CcmA (bactofilin family)
MFNKTGVFGRNDPVTRRDSPPVLGSGIQSSTQSPDRNTVKNTPAASANNANNSAPQPAVAAPTTPAAPAVVTEQTTRSAATEAAGAAGVDNVMGARLIVGPDVKLKGAEILDCDTLVVEGRVEATMDSRVIRIAEKGSFSGKVSIDIAEIHGTFEGELTARSQLIIHSTGRVSGTIRYGKLVADEGGELCGDINVLSESTASKRRTVVETAPPMNEAAS